MAPNQHIRGRWAASPSIFIGDRTAATLSIIRPTCTSAASTCWCAYTRCGSGEGIRTSNMAAAKVGWNSMIFKVTFNRLVWQEASLFVMMARIIFQQKRHVIARNIFQTGLRLTWWKTSVYLELFENTNFFLLISFTKQGTKPNISLMYLVVRCHLLLCGGVHP